MVSDTVRGSGAYRVQPVNVFDVADLAVALGGRSDDATVDAGATRPPN